MIDLRAAVGADIEALGPEFSGVCIDHIPDEGKQLDAISLTVWTNPRPMISGGGSWYYFQVQVRNKIAEIAAWCND